MFVRQQCTQITNGISSDLFNVNNSLGVGVYSSPLSYYSVIPQSFNENFVTTYIASPPKNTFLPLNQENVQTNAQGQKVVVLDCLRNLQIYAGGEQASNQTFLVTGYDDNGIAVQEAITMQADYYETYGYKGFKSIVSVEVVTSGCEGSITVGTNNGIALPTHLCLSAQHIISVSYNNVPLTLVSNTYPTSASEVGFFSNNWRTTEPSATTVDAKGLFVLYQSPNGTGVFSVLYYQYGSDSQLQAQLANNDYSAYTMIGYPSPGPYPDPSNPPLRLPNTQPPLLVAADETGIQYPGQMSAYNIYFNNPTT
jgi:hypothetical protein